MTRRTGSKRNGNAWTEIEINRVWEKARIVPGYPPSQVRKDACNWWIRRSDYGQMTDYGWEIDHVRPIAYGGGDDLANLQPLQWRNNRHKGDSWPNWSCPVSAA